MAHGNEGPRIRRPGRILRGARGSFDVYVSQDSILAPGLRRTRSGLPLSTVDREVRPGTAQEALVNGLSVSWLDLTLNGRGCALNLNSKSRVGRPWGLRTSAAAVTDCGLEDLPCILVISGGTTDRLRIRPG